MPSLYCSRVTIDTKEDVNALLREAGLEDAELLMTTAGAILVAPALSTKRWPVFPQQPSPTTPVPGWEEVVKRATNFLGERFGATSTDPEWIEAAGVFRCPRMESYLRERDL